MRRRFRFMIGTVAALASLATLAVLAAFAALPMAAGAAVPPYDQAPVYPTEAEFLQSIVVYQRAIAANPQDAAAYHWLGYAYWHTAVLYDTGAISYGAGYAPRAVAALRRAVRLDPKDIAAWQMLAVAASAINVSIDYTDFDLDPDVVTGYTKMLSTGEDLTVSGRAVPSTQRALVPIPAVFLPPARMVPAAPTWELHPEAYFVIGDADTKLLYTFSCPTLPPIKHPAFFLTKWEAYARGYQPAGICTP